MSTVIRPRSIDAALQALLEPGAVVLAGGTDVLVWRRAGMLAPSTLVSLQDVEALRGIDRDGTVVRIGAMETHARLLKSDVVAAHVPALRAALRVLGSPLVRASATVGGNIVTASPGGDTLPPLVAYDAELELAGPAGTRRMPLNRFIIGPGRTVRRPGELLVAIRVETAAPHTLHHFEKVGKRNALACAVASMAAVIRCGKDGRVERARLAWGAVAPVILECPDAEASLVGQPLARPSLERAAAVARAHASPITDVRATADYRRALVGNLLLRLERHDR